MPLYPSLETLKTLAQNPEIRRVPVCGEMLADALTPIEAVNLLREASEHVFLLESLEDKTHWGRYSFLGFRPRLCVTAQAGELFVNGEHVDAPVHEYLRELLRTHRSARVEGLPPLTGGLVGYFSFEYFGYTESRLQFNYDDANDFKDLDLMLFDRIIAFDHLKQKILLIVNVTTDDLDANYIHAQMAIEEMKTLLNTSHRAPSPTGRLTGEMTPLFSQSAFCQRVERAKHYITEGDIFQIVLSNRFSGPFEGSLFNTYRLLRTINPSPYLFYFSGTDVEVAGASPETFVKLTDGVLHTFPLAGTRPRGATPEADLALEAELLADEKELAEHNMLVDLGRNDLGKISRFGTVKVEKLRAIERFSHVMHIGSTVRGEIRDDKDALDAISAVLPAGTLSGAPKIRACELIRELEDNQRGIYGGAVGYIDFAGNMDTCIAIRLAYRKGNQVYVRSGAGIVADSVPENEYQECVNKAKAVVRALEQSGEVL